MARATDRSAANVGRGEYTGRVVGQRELGQSHYALLVELAGDGGRSFGAARAGQFVQLACRDLRLAHAPVPLLRRPFSLARVIRNEDGSDAAGGTTLVEIIYRVVGAGTSWLSERRAGEVINLLGPLGNGFRMPAKKEQPILLLGGGVGLPPMFFFADELIGADHKQVLGFAGAWSKDLLVCGLEEEGLRGMGEGLQPRRLVEQFSRSGTRAIVATDDGSCGFAGNVVAAAERFLADHVDWAGADIYACGPRAMLKATAALAQRRGLRCQVCLEAYMACGIGVCQSCVVEVCGPEDKGTGHQKEDEQKHYKLVCAHGPVFDAKDVVWD